MISVKEAESQILSHTIQAPMINLSIKDLKCEVLQRPLYADRNYPPFHRVAMDGIAITCSDWNDGHREFQVQGVQRAGVPALKLEAPNSCIEVMTGAVLPKGCDAVIRYEDTVIKDGVATVVSELDLLPMNNVHQEGSDYQKGELLVKSGSTLESPHWSIAASVGEASVLVSRRPKIAVISTGDELVEVDQQPEAYQIRRSNAYSLLSSLKKSGFNEVSMNHIKDEPSEVRSVLKNALDTSDVLILSGGVSMGKFDFIPRTLEEIGVAPVFHKVKQRPGKPLWFGVTETKQRIFALPGNPVSALVCLHRYVLPSLNKALGATENPERCMAHAVLEEDVQFKKSLTYFLPVSIRNGSDGRTYAQPVRSNGSGDFASLADSHGFIELDEGEDLFSAGQAYPVYYW